MAQETAPDFSDEDYNIRSPERTQLLTQIKQVLDGAPISPAFWACCQLADMNRLRQFAMMDPDLIMFMERPTCFMLLNCKLLKFKAILRWHLT